jgi:predicted phosphodiesterase
MRILVVSDVHSNLEALDAVLADAERGGPIEAIWCAGDIVGYGPDPDAVIGTLRARGVSAVAGNHDLAVCGKMPLDDFNAVAAEAAVWTERHIGDTARDYLATLPLTASPRREVTMVHGSLRSPEWEYLLSAEQAAAQFALQQTPYSIIGHSHLQFWMEERDGQPPRICVADDGAALPLGETRLILNPGSSGQPRDGDPRAGYMLYDDAAAAVTWHRVDYDASVTHRKIVEAGLPPYLGSRLLIGR